MEKDFPEYEVYQHHQRPTLVDDKSHRNHWLNRANDIHVSAGAIWLSMRSDNPKEVTDKLGLGDGFSMSTACFPVYHMLGGLALAVVMKTVLVSRVEQAPEISTTAAAAATKKRLIVQFKGS